MPPNLIQQLNGVRGLEIECPCCAEAFPIKEAKLFNMYASYPAHIQKQIRERLEEAGLRKAELKERVAQLKEDKKRKPAKIEMAAHSSSFGQISEQILPAFITFPYKQRECRILFKPIDYVVFEKLASAGEVESIKLVDVKTGQGRLDSRQRTIRDRITEGKIKHKIMP